MPLPTILSGNVASAIGGGYEVANSCRWNRADSPYMRLDFGSAGNRDKWTFSCWVKKCSNGVEQRLLTTSDNSTFDDNIRFNSDDTFNVICNNATVLTTNRKFRDNSAFYHICVIWDSGNGTSGDRCQLWVNGTRETSFSTASYPSSGQDSYINNNTPHYLGITNATANSHFLHGYFAEVVFQNDSATSPVDKFGEFDSDTPTVFKPIDVSGLTFGTNGFYLDFEDSSNLGNDANGGTDWTEFNLAATDQATDTPTNNFATLNPLYHYIGGAVLSEGNLKFTTSGNSSLGRAMSTIRPESGKWYVECKVIDVTRFNIGLMNGNETNSAQGGEDTNSVILGYGGSFYMAGSFTGYLSSLSNNDIVQLALDLDNDLFWFGVNDTWGNSATRTEIENGTATNSGSTDISSQVPINTGAIGIFLEDNSGTGNNVAEINFGSPSFAISSGNADGNGYGNFEYAVPSGYYALCTKNLAEFGG